MPRYMKRHGGPSRAHAGCKCDECRQWRTEHGRRCRNRARIRAGARIPCILCEAVFLTDHGRATHEGHAHR